MKTSSMILSALISFSVSIASAQELPTLVAKVYPGAAAGNARAGKTVPCGYGEGFHDAFCFLSKDPVEKVLAFYAAEGVKLNPIPVKKDQNAPGDGLYDLEEAVRLQLIREEIGAIYAGPVEFKQSRSAADEPSNFNSVIVMTGKPRAKYSESAKNNKAEIFEDTIFVGFALKPETAAFFNMGIELGVDPDRLIPVANKHIGLQGAFFKKEGGKSLMDKRVEEFRAKRSAELATPGNYEKFQAQENKAKAIDALLGELEKDAYPTMILIQRAGIKSEVTRNPEIVQREWRSAIRPLRSK